MKKFLILGLSVAMLASLCSCSSNAEAEVSVGETVEVVNTTETTVTETTPEVTTFETTTFETANGVKYNMDANVTFDEPLLYEVISEVTVYTDENADHIACTYYEGTCVSAVATDGFYIMQDNGYIIEVSCVQLFE